MAIVGQLALPEVRLYSSAQWQPTSKNCAERLNTVVVWPRASSADFILIGHQVEVDYNEAFRLLSAAAKQGSSRAVLNLARMYAHGLGTSQDVPEAIRLFEAVAKPNDSTDALDARIELGRMFSRDADVPVNRDVAFKWYEAAIELARDGDDSEAVREARAYISQPNP
jgi:TPR repeat protein